MKLTAKIFGFFVLIFFSGAAEIRAQNGEQTSFGIETEIVKTQSIPKYVVEQIIKTDENFSAGDLEDLANRLTGAPVNLNADRNSDLLVQGDSGANITGFWLFRNAGGRWKMILYSRAAWLDIKKAMRRGYRNVEIRAASAVKMWGSLYEFNGAKYVPTKCWEETETGKKIKRRYFRCFGSSVKPYV